MPAVSTTSTLSDPIGAPPTPRAAQKALVGGLLVACALAVVLRAYFYLGPVGRTNSDESVVGLMARDLLANGRWRPFYWGQSYGGTAVLPLLAAMRAVFGTSVFALRLSNILLVVAAMVMLWMVAARFLDRRAATVTVVAFSLVPAAFVVWSAMEMLFYLPTMVLGLVIMVVGTRIVERPQRTWPFVVFWVAAGVGFWESAFIAYYLLPVGLFMVLSLRRIPARLLATLPLFFVGSLPWWAWNLAKGFPSLQEAQVSLRSSPADRLYDYVTSGLRTAFGLSTEDSTVGRWSQVTWILFLVLLGLLIVVAVRAVRRALNGGAVPLDVLGILCGAVVYAILPLRTAYPVPRYFIFIWPFTSMLIGRLVVGRRTSVVVTAAIVAVGAFTMHGLSKQVTAPDLTTLESALQVNNIHTAYADYWVAYRMMYETNGEVIVGSYYVDRQPRFAAAVRAAPTSNYIFPRSHPDRALVEDAARARGIPFHVIEAGDWVIDVIEGRLPPEEVSPTRPLTGY